MIGIRMTLDVSDMEKLAKSLDSEQIRKLLLKTIEKTLQPTVRAARALAPRVTGKLARSIRVRANTRGPLVIAIRGAPYGHLVEYGHRLVAGGRVTRAGRQYSRVNGVLTGRRGGRYTGRVIGFVPPKPFVRPAIAATIPEVEQDVKLNIETGLQATQRAA